MNPSRPFILRPIATSLLMAAILLIGIIGYRQLPIAALPEVDYPTMQVLTFYPGASADVVATGITASAARRYRTVFSPLSIASIPSDGWAFSSKLRRPRKNLSTPTIIAASRSSACGRRASAACISSAAPMKIS